MDYKLFFEDVVAWIQQANQMAGKHGMGSEVFWNWVADSSGEITKKYDENPLAIKQMMMMSEWLEDVYEQMQG